MKVLSSGALRGRIERVESPRRLIVSHAWEAPEGFINGMTFRRLGESGPAGVPVSAYTPGATGSSIIQLSAPVEGLRAGDAFEIDAHEQPPILAARLATGTGAGRSLPPIRMRLATTRGTNALLERRGADIALFITRGFADLLAIGTQQRPDLFSLRIDRPEPLMRHVTEVAERLSADGKVLVSLDLDQIARDADRLLAQGVRVAAVALMHSWLEPAHERAVAAMLRERGFEHVSCSSELAPSINLLNRTQTAVVNAYLAPVLGEYLAGVSAAIAAAEEGGGRGSLHVLTSSGGLVGVGSFAPKDSLLSGPAGGVVGAAAAARGVGLSRVITFDMGGTSTDVARFDGDHEYVFEHQVGPARIVATAVAVESVAAGGGSVCWFDRAAGVLRVGPRSAGASPGPACYGAGGPLTVTDVNLLLGRLDAGRFEIPVDRAAAEARARELAAEVQREGGGGAAVDLEAMLEGLVEIADERMAEAIRAVSVRRGYDPADHALVAFGGAGGQHACGVAERLGMETVVVPRDVGLLSAVGVGLALVERFAERQVLRGLEAFRGELAHVLEELGTEAAEAVAAEGVERDEIVVRRRLVSVRLAGQESSLTVEVEDGEVDRAAAVVRARFGERYRAVFGYDVPRGRDVEVESVRVVASSRRGAMRNGAVLDTTMPRSARSNTAPKTTSARFAGSWRRTPVHERDDLRPGDRLTGPALIVESFATTVVPPGWEVEANASGSLVLRRSKAGADAPAAAAASQPEAVRDAVLTGRLSAIATEMGETLRRTALSTNVKERLDYSCAILDADAQLVVNAPHVPVHLGALGPCVRALRDAIEMGPGDVVVTNHPAFGGSHLPDVTVVTPVYDARRRLLGYVASRAHHAEIGGITPGSMPPRSASLAEEGVILPPMHLVRAGQERLEDVRAALLGGPWPTRAVEENMADLAAQAAANRRGEAALLAMAEEVGAGELARAMRALKARAESGIRRALSSLGDGVFEAEERLDDGSTIRVSIRVRDGAAAVDFAGSAGLHPGNFNAPPGVVRSALIYVLRLLIDEPLPLNEGLMRAVQVSIPPGMLNPTFPPDDAACPAVAAGNVETSQRTVDALLRALRLAAGSQGTMNNVIFGNPRFGYYETVCGGAGAGPGFAGADAVHTHMTNTRITDPEILERRYPVRLERFGIRRGSGGPGRWRGGDGAVREYAFLEPVSLSVLTQHRASGPYGLNGGGAGAPGRQWVTLASGGTVELAAVDGRDLVPGDRLVLETPGGGGYGPPDSRT